MPDEIKETPVVTTETLDDRQFLEDSAKAREVEEKVEEKEETKVEETKEQEEETKEGDEELKEDEKELRPEDELEELEEMPGKPRPTFKEITAKYPNLF